MPWEEQNHFTFGMQKYLKVSNEKAESLKQLFSGKAVAALTRILEK